MNELIGYILPQIIKKLKKSTYVLDMTLRLLWCYTIAFINILFINFGILQRGNMLIFCYITKSRLAAFGPGWVTIPGLFILPAQLTAIFHNYCVKSAHL